MAEHYSDSVVSAAQLLSMASQEAGHRTDEEARYALQCGVDGRRYERYRELVKLALIGREVSREDALFALHFVTEFAFVRD